MLWGFLLLLFDLLFFIKENGNTMVKENLKEWAIFGSGMLVLIAGIVLAFIAIFIPPAGIISGSVLAVIAEFLTFAGSAMGIGSYTAIQIHKIDKKVEKDNNEAL